MDEVWTNYGLTHNKYRINKVLAHFFVVMCSLTCTVFCKPFPGSFWKGIDSEKKNSYFFSFFTSYGIVAKSVYF